jgi:hypothetical protein
MYTRDGRRNTFLDEKPTPVAGGPIKDGSLIPPLEPIKDVSVRPLVDPIKDGSPPEGPLILILILISTLPTIS